MPSKKPALLRKSHAKASAAGANIPTTIKNPERVAWRRNELIEVATRMFLERGFHNTSIRDIARECSFNVASLYMYVSSKDDILYLVAQDLMRNIANRLKDTKLDPNSPERSLEIGFASYCQIADRFRRPIRLLYREVGFMPPDTRTNVIGTVSSVIDYFETIIRNGIESGAFRPVSARLAALDIMTVAHMIALHTREVRTLGDLDFYVRNQLKIIFAGLLATSRKRSGRATGSKPKKAAAWHTKAQPGR